MQLASGNGSRKTHTKDSFDEKRENAFDPSFISPVSIQVHYTRVSD